MLKKDILVWLFVCLLIYKQLLFNFWFPGGSVVKNLPANAGDIFHPWVGKIPWRMKWQPSPIFLPKKSQGQLSNSEATTTVGFLCAECPQLLCHVPLCDPMDCSLPGSSVHRIFQARIMEWVTIPCSSGLPIPPRDWTWVSISCTVRQIIYHCATWEVPLKYYEIVNILKLLIKTKEKTWSVFLIAKQIRRRFKFS